MQAASGFGVPPTPGGATTRKEKPSWARLAVGAAALLVGSFGGYLAIAHLDSGVGGGEVVGAQPGARGGRAVAKGPASALFASLAPLLKESSA